MIETFIIYAIAVSISVFLLYLLGISIAPYAPNKIKNEHFECGLPASAATPKKANFGFFVYAIMFIVADMTGLFFTLFVYATDRHASIVAATFAIIIALAITLSMKEHHAQNS
jgi:NADH-quinone oxidoreductase subunit A